MKTESSNMSRLILTLVLLIIVGSAFAQTEKKSIRRGNNAYEDNDFVESEVQYRKALESNAHSIKGNYNLANSLYKQEKYEDAIATSNDINLSGLSDVQKAAVYHNQGNAFFKQQKYKESIDSYKKSLRLNPKDIETKYNLSEALRMQQQQQEQQQNQDKNQNNDRNKDNKDNQQDQDNKDKNNDKQDDKKEQDKQNQDQQNQDKQQQQQPQISKEDAERMLEAIQNNEKDVQDKMKKEKAKAAKAKVLKNW